MNLVGFLTDILKTGLPGLAAAALAFFTPITGVGLAHEGWENAVQKTASFFGVLVTIYIVFQYGKVSKDQKLIMIRKSLYVTGRC